MGLMVQSLEVETAKRKELGRELTAEERSMVRVNEVKRTAIAIEGAYAVGAATTTGKIQSMDRVVNTLQVSLGKAFTPALGTMIDEITRAITGMTASLKDGGGVAEFGKKMQVFLIDALAGWRSLM